MSEGAGPGRTPACYSDWRTGPRCTPPRSTRPRESLVRAAGREASSPHRVGRGGRGEVEAEDPELTETISRALVEPIQDDYAEILVYQRPDGRRVGSAGAARAVDPARGVRRVRLRSAGDGILRPSPGRNRAPNAPERSEFRERDASSPRASYSPASIGERIPPSDCRDGAMRGPHGGAARSGIGPEGANRASRS